MNSGGALETEESESGARHDQALWRGFNMILLCTFLAFFWCFSYPGVSFLVIFVFLFSALLVPVWISLMRNDRRGHIPRRVWAVGPALSGLLFLLVITSVPVRARFLAAQGAFDEQVANLEPAGTYTDWEHLVDVPDRLGTFRITRTGQVGNAVIFYEQTGSFLDDAGFAYLPDGPTEELATPWFEAPSFRHLWGDWYTWTASW